MGTDLQEQRLAVLRCDLEPEATLARWVLAEAHGDEAMRQRIFHRGAALVSTLRSHPPRGLDALLHAYAMDTSEGIALLCLAESLLRLSDEATAEQLIAERLTSGDWERARAEGFWAHASIWGLVLGTRVVDMRLEPRGILRRLVGRLGEGVVRRAVVQAVRLLARQFIVGRTITEALERAEQERFPCCSFDMLGEAARTREDAERYFMAYQRAIGTIGARCQGSRTPAVNHGISIKLSALEPRFEPFQLPVVLPELIERVRLLVEHAAAYGLGVTLDAEESWRLDGTLRVFEALLLEPGLSHAQGLGLAVQAYQKRAIKLVDYLVALARARGRHIMIRLVKGAYWDTEIKRAQVSGLDGYPVWTRKAATDCSYLACAKRLLAARDVIYPQFATHNAHTVAAVLEWAGGRAEGFELQRLHGMGEALYAAMPDIPHRVYAPVGSYEELLPYLVRRLLENGANTSFINRLADASLPLATLLQDPAEALAACEPKAHPGIPLPRQLFPGRQAARGLDLANAVVVEPLWMAVQGMRDRRWQGSSIIAGEAVAHGPVMPCLSPADREHVLGEWSAARREDCQLAMATAQVGFASWSGRPVSERAAILERAAERLEAEQGVWLPLLILEGGKILADALSELREAVDFLRYYALQARRLLSESMPMPGPTGEDNQLWLAPRGVFVCISPWNFPLSIFLGQISAALVCGNTVVAKPAEETPLVATAAIRLLLDSGVPGDVLQLVLGGGKEVGEPLLDDPHLAGVAFTGGTETAWRIQERLAQRRGPVAPFIAETGGLNGMIVDASALPEQVVDDVIASAFGAAGQRCSALRVLCVQEDLAPRLLSMLQGAMATLQVGHPMARHTDIGPVISTTAACALEDHARRMAELAKPIGMTPLPTSLPKGHYVAPRAFLLEDMALLQGEVFGPMLHVITFPHDRLEEQVLAFNATGFGLTMGVHSRLQGTIETVRRLARVGNLYVNRSMVGAVVESQPFGGEGLSGTGPKAGGPHYLLRFLTERSVAINTTAWGGNASLMSLEG
jgi:RHH-type proline utilization regulon transcriptional repressor/proline dehydrogenase/delta 1-pyrroline-5-carboxylate dehydrogenase